MRNISFLTKFQILSNHFRIINSARNYAGQKKTVKEPAIKWESGLNEVRLLGRLGKDPWLRTVQGKPTLHLLVEIPEVSPPKRGEEKTKPNWHILYTQNQGMMKCLQVFLKKGMRVYFCGQLSLLEKSKDNFLNVRVTRFICV